MACATTFLLLCLVVPLQDWAQASHACRRAKGTLVENWNRMLDGQWYWVAAVMDSDSQSIKDCSGFRGRRNKEGTNLDVIVTDSVAISSAKVFKIQSDKSNNVTVPYGEEKCLMFNFSIKRFRVGYHNQSNTLCFYSCGVGTKKDYVSCFARRQSIQTSQLNAINSHFKGENFNLDYSNSLLKRINREGCEI